MIPRRTALMVASLLALSACAETAPAGPPSTDTGEAGSTTSAECAGGPDLQIRYWGLEDTVYNLAAFVELKDGDTLRAVEDFDGRAHMKLNYRVSDSQERMEHEIVLLRDGVAIGSTWRSQSSQENGVDQFDDCYYSFSSLDGIRALEEVGSQLPYVATGVVLEGPVDIQMTVLGTLTGDRFTTTVRNVTLVETD